MGAFGPLLLKAAPLIISGLSSASGAGKAAEAGRQTEADLNRQVELEKLGAKDRSIERRRRFNKVLAGQIAETGARGIAFEGSPQAVAKGDITQFELEKTGAQVSDLEKITQLKRQARTARKSAERSQRTKDILLPTTGAGILLAGTGLGLPKRKKTKPASI